MRYEERGLQNHERRLDELEDLVKQLNQRSYAPIATPFGSGDSGGGGYYADPGSVVIASDDSETLTVMEVRSSGDLEVGEREVINRMPDDTIEDARMLLIRNRDGSFTVYQQACPPEGG